MSELSQRLRELLAKATPGPWQGAEYLEQVVEGSIHGESLMCSIDMDLRPEDGRLICELVNNAPAIIAALEAVEKGEV